MKITADILVNRITEEQWAKLFDKVKDLGLSCTEAKCTCKCGAYLLKAFGHNYYQGGLGISPNHLKSLIRNLSPKLSTLPDHSVCRCELRKMAEDSIVHNMPTKLDVIISVLAWGNGGIQRQKGRWQPYLANTSNMEKISTALDNIYKYGIAEKDYNVLLGISGIGISFASKIIFFYSPKNNNCILDKIVSENIKKVIGYDFYKSTYTNYVLYNEFLKIMAKRLDLASSELVEILFFR